MCAEECSDCAGTAPGCETGPIREARGGDRWSQTRDSRVHLANSVVRRVGDKKISQQVERNSEVAVERRGGSDSAITGKSMHARAYYGADRPIRRDAASAVVNVVVEIHATRGVHDDAVRG